MIIATKEMIRAAITNQQIIDAVRFGAVSAHKGVYKVPERIHVGDEDCTFLVMPAMGTNYYCTKLVSVIPSNDKRGLPIVSGDIILNDRTTGQTLALLDATTITALRTAAIGAAGLDIISSADTDTIGIIGCGVQGLHQAIFATSVREIKYIKCYNRSKGKYDSFVDQLNEALPDVEVDICGSADELVRKSQAIYACTNSSSPVFSNDVKLTKGKCFISVGSFTPRMQELPEVVYTSADKIMIDADSATHEAGDIVNGLKNNWIIEDDLVTMGEQLSTGVLDCQSENIVFKSVGNAAFDFAVTVAIYHQLEKPTS